MFYVQESSGICFYFIIFSDPQAMSEDTILETNEGLQVKALIDEIRAQSPGRILPLHIITQDGLYENLEPFISKLIQEKSDIPGLNISYYEFYNSHLKGISQWF